LKKQITNILKFLFFLSIGILLIWLAVHNKTEEEISNIKLAIKQANYFWIVVSLIVTGLSHVFRAIRWRMLLKPLGHQVKISNTFFAVMVGYLANFALPRLGEVTRCGILTKYEKVPFTEAFGTVVTERALDLVCLIIIFFTTLALEFKRISGIANELIFTSLADKMHVLMQKQLFLICLGTFFILIITLLYYVRAKIRNLISGKVSNFVKGIWDGLKSVAKVEKPVLFVFHTIAIWTMYILQVYVCFFAFGETSQLAFGVAIVIVVFGSVGIIAVPGGTGAYQAIVIQILTSVYLISATVAFAFAWAVWTTQFVLILFLGLLSLVLLALLNKEKGQ